MNDKARENGNRPLLDVRGLRTYFDTDQGVARAVDGIDFSVAAGECVALVGESGCGKSVTSYSIMRLLPEPPARIAGGQVLIDGVNLLTLSRKEMCAHRGSRCAMIFQEPQSALNPVFRIGRQVAETYRIHQPNASRQSATELVVAMLRKVGIPDPESRIWDYPHQLSGGMKQRVCIAMALICGPKLLIADEPTTALDVTIQAQILKLLRDLRREQKLAMLLITHDLGVVAENAERVCVMYAGKIVESGTAADIFLRPLHPYTQGLLRSRPRPGSSQTAKRERLAVIPGMVPAAVRFPEGCRFAPRCPWADAACRTQPESRDFGGNHCVACVHAAADGGDAWRETADAVKGAGS
jgi:oligopeptide/dipeptide ABC transporter ATP-binding protein